MVVGLEEGTDVGDGEPQGNENGKLLPQLLKMGAGGLASSTVSYSFHICCMSCIIFDMI